MILLLISTFYHARLGLQVVIEDYVHHEGLQARGADRDDRCSMMALAVAGIVAVLKVSLGS